MQSCARARFRQDDKNQNQIWQWNEIVKVFFPKLLFSRLGLINNDDESQGEDGIRNTDNDDKGCC